MTDVPQEGAPTSIDFDKVAGDLRNAAAEDVAAEQAQAPPQPVEPAPTDQGQAASEQPQPDVDSFMNLDPATLPPELQAQYKNMQADYTRKMQEVGPYRDLAEQYGVTAEEMAQAVEFVGRIQSDPAYTQQVYSSLGEYLGQMGFRQPQAAPAPVDNEFGDEDYGDPDFDPAASPVDTPAQVRSDPLLEQRLAQVEQLLYQNEQQQYVRSLASQIKQQEFGVREANPDMGDGDIQRIYELAPSYSGDLHQAAEAYKGWRTEILQGYLQSKSQPVPAAGSPQRAITGTDAPSYPNNLREATLRAEEALNQALGDT